MFQKFWDKEHKYTEGFLKEYEHWLLEVSYRQHTLGCYIIFTKRPVEKMSDLKDEEIIELTKVMAEIEAVLLKTAGFQPDRFNYWQMGNGLHQLHFHGIPRYSAPRVFAGHEWTDKTWGGVPVWLENDCSHELVAKVRDALAPNF